MLWSKGAGVWAGPREATARAKQAQGTEAKGGWRQYEGRSVRRQAEAAPAKGSPGGVQGDGVANGEALLKPG